MSSRGWFHTDVNVFSKQVYPRKAKKEMTQLHELRWSVRLHALPNGTKLIIQSLLVLKYMKLRKLNTDGDAFVLPHTRGRYEFFSAFLTSGYPVNIFHRTITKETGAR